MDATICALLVSADKQAAEAWVQSARHGGIDLDSLVVCSTAEFRSAITDRNLDIILTSFNGPPGPIEALQILHQTSRDIPLILIAGPIGEDALSACFRAGASDYLPDAGIARLPEILRDILRSRQELTSRRKLEDHARLLDAAGTLAGGLAHDINNILTTIFGNIDLARALIADSASVLRSLEAVERATLRASGITRSLLTFDRRSAPEKRPISAHELLHSSADLLRGLLPDTIRQEWQPPSGPLFILGDQAQLQQVLLNLALNARDAMPAGGKLNVSLAVCDFTQAESGFRPPRATPGNYLRIDVRDSGSGMSELVQAHLFEPFFTTKPRKNGSGLGLSVARGIVEAHGGWIGAESEPGQGSLFSVFLPLQEPHAEKTGAPATTLDPAEVPVLLIEDNPSIRELMADALRRSRYDVIEASNPEQAIKAAKDLDRKIGVAICEIDLPETSGIECLNLIRAQSPAFRGLLLTSGETEATPDAAAKPPLLPYPVLIKPFQMRVLRSTVAALAGCFDELASTSR